MKNRLNTFMNIWSIILLSVLYFIANRYPIHIIETDVSLPVIYIALNLMFVTLYFVLLNISLSADSEGQIGSVFESGVSLKKLVFSKKTLIFIIVCLVFDCVTLFLGDVSFALQFAVKDILEICRLLVAFLLISYNKESKAFHPKTTTVILLGAFFAIANCVLDHFLALPLNEYLLKYTDRSPVLMTNVENAKFFYEIKACLSNILLAVILIVAVNMPLIRANREEENPRRTRAVALLRIFIISSVASVLSALSVGVCADTALFPMLCQDSGQHTSYTVFDGFVTQHQENYVVRSLDKRDYKVYSNYTLWIGDTRSEETEFTLSSVFYPRTSEDSENAGITTEVVRYINGEPVMLYKNCAVCYEENGTLTVIRAEDIKNCEENEILIAFCKKLLKDEHIVFFEYSAEYLYRYEKEFTEPYLNRYANGEFTDSEREKLDAACYREDHMINLARDVQK